MRMNLDNVEEMAQRLSALSYSCKGPGSDSQHPHGGLQLALTSIPGDLNPFSDL